MPSRISLAAVTCAMAIVVGTLAAAERSSPAAGPLRLLKSGRVPEQRLGTILQLVCRRGNADDLAYVFEQSVSADGFSPATRREALDALAEAALTRKMRPTGSLEGLGRLIDSTGKDADRATQLTAIRLAGIWKVAALGARLEQIALAPETDPRLRRSAVGALSAIGGLASRAAIEKLITDDRPQAQRYLGLAALAQFDLNSAATRAAAVLSDGTASDDPALVVEAFLGQNQGAQQLAAALRETPPTTDVAKLALRHMYSIGRSDAELVAALSKAAGISASTKPVSASEVKQLVAEVLSQGDPRRGETVFRRADLSCMKCHAVSKAGGDVGPELSAVGTTSPPDYLVKSILLPDQAIKEAFLTTIIITDEGQVFQGIAVDRDDRRIVLKEASGAERSIPLASIDEEERGRSLMPKGLANFMTRGELADLARFLSELGKPGEFAIRSQPTIQRWRNLRPVPDELIEAVPDEEAFGRLVLEAEASAWQPAYAKVAGTLPLAELTGGDDTIVCIQGEVNVTVAGRVNVALNSSAGTYAWIDGQPFDAQQEISTELSRGLHKITLRVDLAQRADDGLRVVIVKPEGSTAQFTVVGGR